MFEQKSESEKRDANCTPSQRLVTSDGNLNQAHIISKITNESKPAASSMILANSSIRPFASSQKYLYSVGYYVDNKMPAYA